MSDDPTLMEPQTTMNLNNRRRSGSWSGYQYWKPQQEQQQLQHIHHTQPDTKAPKSSFLTKFIQKRTIASTDGTTTDDPSFTVQLQPLVLPDPQQPMLSTPLLKKTGQATTKKKGKSLGRFLKKLGKNSTTGDKVTDLGIYNQTTLDEPPSPLLGSSNNLQQTVADNLAKTPILIDLGEQDQLAHSAKQHEHITTTPIDTVAVMEPSRPTLFQESLRSRSAKDDLHLQYNRIRDIGATPLPRSSSFEGYRSHIPTSSMHPELPSFYSNKSKLPSPTQSLSNQSSRNGDTFQNEPTSTVSEDNVDIYNNNGDDDDDRDSTINSMESDLEEEQVATGVDLTKRLSGGHFGSAGGLIINTLSLSDLSTINSHASLHINDHHQDIKQYENNDQNPTFEPTPTSTPPIMQQKQQEDEGDDVPLVYKLNTDWTDDRELGSTGLATPPRGNSNDIRKDDMEVRNDDNDDNDDNGNGDNDVDHVIENDLDNLSVLYSQSSSMVNDVSTAEDYARRIWEQDDTVYSNLEHVAEWIGNGSSSSRHILKCYMSYFDFSHQRLEDAFRQLCGKLSMKAESQQIDRILEEFSKRYWECNPQAIFGNADVIHAIVYSLVLLNTDLHIAQGERKKMSRPAFIRNTMDAIRSQLDYPRTNFNATTDNLNNHNDDGARSLSDIKHTSTISLQSQQQKDWKELKRTPSGRSNYSQNSGYRGKMSSSFDLSSPALDSTFGSYIWQSEMELLLKQLYTSVRHRQIMHPGSSQDAACDTFGPTRKSNGAPKRNVGTRMWKAARESLFISDSSNNNGVDVDFLQPLTPSSTISSMSGKHSRRRSISSMRSGTSQHSQYTRSSTNNNGNGNHHYSGGTGSVNYQAVASLLHHSNLPTSFTSVAPYYKEGMLVRKHLMEQANQKARQRDWKECFMVVDRGEIRMYRLEAHGQRRKSMVVANRHPLHGMISRGASLATVSESILSSDQSSITSGIALGGGDWLAHAQMIGRIDLKHTLSNALPSGYSQQRQHAFALQQANGGVYLFQVGSTEQVMEWVTTCNYWAARESKEPLMGGVGNLEYGWGACLDGMTTDDENNHSDKSIITLHQWQPPTPPLMASALGEMAQLDTLLQHIRTLNDELDRHRDLKRTIERRFPRKTSNHVCAMSNFENKTQYLLHEIIKYQNYCDSIENSLALQDKAIQDKNPEQVELVGT
ncbi:hypothetical protein BC941DRAFT_415232 [Chlamydoabsidia padenii]|nr:hypothetical protein BC941DRAFT_415232 [Chlamydoabsidia padenii]